MCGGCKGWSATLPGITDALSGITRALSRAAGIMSRVIGTLPGFFHTLTYNMLYGMFFGARRVPDYLFNLMVRMRKNETFLLIALFLLVSTLSFGQRTWWGEIAGGVGGGGNMIFRFQEADGAGSATGKGYWGSEAEVRRLIGDKFSLGAGLGYWQNYYYTTPAPGQEGTTTHGSYGLVTVPFRARIDLLNWFFADGGMVLSWQPCASDIDDMTGLGATLGAGVQYRFRSDFFIWGRLSVTQYALVPFRPESHQQRMLNGGVTAGVGYRFIHLGRCNCPDDNSPRRRRFF